MVLWGIYGKLTTPYHPSTHHSHTVQTRDQYAPLFSAIEFFHYAALRNPFEGLFGITHIIHQSMLFCKRCAVSATLMKRLAILCLQLLFSRHLCTQVFCPSSNIVLKVYFGNYTKMISQLRTITHPASQAI